MALDHVREAMTEFWKDNSKDTSLEEMMLDNSAVVLNEEELPEILSYLPDVTGKTVLELGAGIGRFTSYLAQKAEKVIAVDFMQDFIEKNRATNEHFGNVEFIVADVTTLERPEKSVDLIFSNWLMMYLEDTEVMTLFQKELSWLRSGGHLFLRESCFHGCGNKSVKSNPTKYRSPETYTAMYSSVQLPCDEKNIYGFDLLLSKSVDTYIKFRKNNNQVIWLLQKTTSARDSKTLQNFLDDEMYNIKAILLYEKIFGHTFVSTGGLSTTMEFTSMLKLKPGQRVLDVGGGIGGSAFYMAKTFGVHVVSLDLSSSMTQIGRIRAEEVGCGPDKVVFENANALKRDYQPESFDVIYSRDAILHIDDKETLFKKLFKCLKPGGKVLISDYCCGLGTHSDSMKQYIEHYDFHLLSLEEYGKVLENSGFVNVQVEDRSLQFADISHSDVANLESLREELIKDFGESRYQYILDVWKGKIKRDDEGQQKWVLFYAEKV